MRINLKTRKAKTLIISYVAAAFLITGGFAIQSHARAVAYQNTLSNVYQHAFTELATAMSEVNTSLQKLSYATSPTLVSSLCTELFGKTSSAQMALGELPYSNVELEQTASFIAKVGDYAVALSRNTAMNGACSDEERQNLQSLAEASASLSQMLEDLSSDIYRNVVTLEDLDQATARLTAATEKGGEINAGAYKNIESEFPELPTLVYDGPFSEHLTDRVPKLLEGKEDVTKEQALTAAAQFLGVKSDILAVSNTLEGNLPGWGFSATIEGGEVYVEVARKGGVVVQMINSRPAGEAAYSTEEATQEGLAFLQAHGYENLVPTYYISKANLLTINLAAVQDGVILYPDLIKVTVALDTCRVMGFDARGYLMNHTQRTLPQPTVSKEEAQSKVDGGLEVLSYQLALIPTSGEYEILCHEFKCQTADGRHYLFYINVETGNEERILLLLEDETGTLVI
ncbi:Germination protein YpeB [uncultured Eubacteriales bacterium]|uniref:Germination protein YpeB n=1 Tax=uncultured Eubacteriales bacterium TaxID=172733 RepID=A0A212JYA9_9FIRM|nr:Germination protein YpeB [uncultured Eubacteriales bacterium]